MMKDESLVPYPFLKRITDKLLAFSLILIFFPVITVIFSAMFVNMLICPADRGCWFYREQRLTRGKKFHVLKFRVLRENVLARLRREGKHARLYESDPHNLTWAGRHLLKKWYFDELPQLLNILKGDMSLVGPRPWPIHMVEDQFERCLTYRRLIMAGWTGPAQLQKEKSTPDDEEKLDLAYVAACRTWNTWHLWRYDLTLLYRTIEVMLHGQGLKY